MADIHQYCRLITSQHADKPKFMAMVSKVCQPWVDIQNLLASMPMAYDLDEATGLQLDVLGQWTGVRRRVHTPLTGVYFAYDTEDVGWGSGVWQGKFDPEIGISQLDDESYRMVIRAKIAANQWSGTNETLKDVLDLVFTNGSYAVVEDNQDMTITVGLAGVRPPQILISLLVGGYLSVKPATVAVRYYITPTIDGPLFGFDIQTPGVAGFDLGQFGLLVPGEIP